MDTRARKTVKGEVGGQANKKGQTVKDARHGGGGARDVGGDIKNGDIGGTAEKSGHPAGAQKNTGAGGKYRTSGRKTEEREDESAEWGEEDTEELASEEEATTAMGAGEDGRPLTAKAGESEEISADGEPGGTAAGRGDTGDATSATADEAGSGGHHWARTATRERVAGRQENPDGESYEVGGGGEVRETYRVASKPSGVRGDGGGSEAYGVAEKSRRDHQGVGGGVESPQGIDTPAVDALPWGDETPGVATEDEGVTGEDGQGRGVGGTPPTTRASKDS